MIAWERRLRRLEHLMTLGIGALVAGNEKSERCQVTCVHEVASWLSDILCTVASQVLLSIGFSRQEYWSGLPCTPPVDLPNPEIKPMSLMSPDLAGRFFITSATWEAWKLWYINVRDWPSVLWVLEWIRMCEGRVQRQIMEWVLNQSKMSFLFQKCLKPSYATHQIS